MVGEIDAVGIVSGEERGDLGLDFLGGEGGGHGFCSVKMVNPSRPFGPSSSNLGREGL